MKTKTIVGAVLGLMVLGLFSFILFPPGTPRFRRSERAQAQSEFNRVPSDENKQKVAKEFTLLRKYEKTKSLISLGVLIPAYILFVLYLWKQEKKA